MRKRTKKKGKPIHKLRIYNFFSKPETEYLETDQKKEADQNTKILNVFPETGNQ